MHRVPATNASVYHSSTGKEYCSPIARVTEFKDSRLSLNEPRRRLASGWRVPAVTERMVNRSSLWTRNELLIKALLRRTVPALMRRLLELKMMLS